MLLRGAYTFFFSNFFFLLKFDPTLRGHLQADLRTLNVKMTFRGYSRDVNVQKCMYKPTFLVKIMTLRRGEWEGFSLTSK